MTRPTAEQLRAARAWLGLSREQVAHLSDLHVGTIHRAEDASWPLSPRCLRKILAVYQAQGVAFRGISGIERSTPA